jgi:formate dehydrogenase alpha subunit
MMRVNGLEIEPRGSVLDAIRAAGADLPAFCADARLSVGGHCRSCLVEMDGRLVAACTTPARDNAQVVTESERLSAYRRDLAELMLSECAPRGEVLETLHALGADGTRYGPAAVPAARDTSHPYLRIDLTACILCRRCVRACEEIQGQFVYAFEGRGADTRLAWGAKRFAESPCVSCGACVSACPSGAISSADLDRTGERDSDAISTRTTCGYCGVGCQLDVHHEPSQILHIEGAPAAVNRGHLCVKGRYAHGFARHPERLRAPLIRSGARLVEATWEEAIAHVAAQLARHQGKVAGLSSSRCTNEENYLFQKWMRGGLGTNDVDCCARVCHAPSAVGMRAAFGLGAATNSLADIDRADALFVIGANVTEAHPVTGARIREAALRGTALVVIDPRRTELTAIADLHLQLKPGANVPLLNAIAAVLVEEDLVNHAFLDTRVEGWDAYRAFISAHGPERAEPVTGVPADEIRGAARLFGRAARPMTLHGLGVTEHLQGSEAVMLICNLALLTGAVGREGVGVNPLRGQNNVQGSADMGCQPDLLPGYARVDDAASRASFERVWKRTLPERPGRTLPRMYEAILRGDVRALVILGEDVLQTDPDMSHTRAALEALDFLVVQELFLSETARLADVVLPGASFLEKDGTFTNGERRIQRVRRVLPPIAGARSDLDILLELMAATGYPQAFTGPSDVMDEIALVAPMFAGVSYRRLEGDGLQWPVPAADHPGTPFLHAETFPSGRGRLSCVEYTPSPELRGGLTLVTGRRLEHYNSGTMTRRTPNLALAPDERIEMHPDDASARSLADGDRVRVTSDHGHTNVPVEITRRVPRGTVFLTFHFPYSRTNVLTGDIRDTLSDCPEYKVTAVEIERADA